KNISSRYDGVDVTQLLSELSQRAGVDFVYEPGSIERVPADFRKIKLLLDNATIKQALESIAAFTGLGYVANDNGVYFWNATYGFGAAGRDPVIATMQLDNGVTVLMTESKTPRDVKEYIQFNKEREYKKLH